MANLNVLIWHPGASPFGGHRVQMEMTAAALEKAGVSVRLTYEQKPSLDAVDIVHGFDLSSHHVRAARSRGIPVCLSVIYLNKDYWTGLLHRRRFIDEVFHRARMTGVLAVAAARGQHAAKAEAFSDFVIRTTATYEAVDLLLPNSELEAICIRQDLGVSTPMRVVPNAVEPSLFYSSVPWEQREGVVYVARLEPHKNQLGLIEALRGTRIGLTLVGGKHPHHPRYADAVKAKAHGNVRFLGPIAHTELKTIYSQARVHAIPSRFETTGLVSLEAALCGCNIVSTSIGYAHEYLGSFAWYCDPFSKRSIRNAILLALEAPPQDALRVRIRDNYTWQHTADATIGAYRELLRKPVGDRPHRQPRPER